MNAFVSNVAKGTALTANGALTYASTGSALVDLFGSIGSSRNNIQGAIAAFTKAFACDKLIATKILFWARDVRGGAGEREVFRQVMQYLETVDLTTVLKNMKLVPEFGRYDDLLVFKTPHARAMALKVFADAITAGNGLACKWAPRKGSDAVALTKQLGVTPKQYRKMIVQGSNTVEQKLCAQKYTEIDYEQVPSVAALRYQETFARHDKEGYAVYRERLLRGEVNINSGTLFPHNLAQQAKQGGAKRGDLLEAQWKALPDYMAESKERILPMIDVSGSMDRSVGGNPNMRCMDVSVGIGAYVALKQKGAFSGMYLTFESEPRLCKADTSVGFVQMIKDIYRADWGGSTNIQAAFHNILQYAKTHRVSQEDMPTMLLVLSDMQFDCTDHGGINFHAAKYMFAAAGYALPKLVWWNLNDEYGNKPVGAEDSNQMLLSGYSPSIMQAVLNMADIPKPPTPFELMMEVINSNRYDGVTV